jgi:hypothetical protein
VNESVVLSPCVREIAVLTAEKCRDYAAQSKALGLTDFLTESSVHHTIMSVKWSALAEMIDRDNLSATAAAFGMKSSRLSGCD